MLRTEITFPFCPPLSPWRLCVSPSSSSIKLKWVISCGAGVVCSLPNPDDHDRHRGVGHDDGFVSRIHVCFKELLGFFRLERRRAQPFLPACRFRLVEGVGFADRVAGILSSTELSWSKAQQFSTFGATFLVLEACAIALGQVQTLGLHGFGRSFSRLWVCCARRIVPHRVHGSGPSVDHDFCRRRSRIANPLKDAFGFLFCSASNTPRVVRHCISCPFFKGTRAHSRLQSLHFLFLSIELRDDE